MATYRGFTTINKTRKFRLTDFELVKRDLTNHFHIRKGEKLMNPNFGTIIWNVIHDPFTTELKNAIIADVKEIAAYDPRISIDNVIITEYETGIQLELELRYLTTNQTSVMNLRFDNRTNTLSSV